MSPSEASGGAYATVAVTNLFAISFGEILFSFKMKPLVASSAYSGVLNTTIQMFPGIG